MKITEYRIRNYKAVKDTSIKLNYSLNPIIGVNESGKTTILSAILAFDKNRDKVNSGIHLEFKNKYSTGATKDSRITANLILNKDELAELKKTLNLRSEAPEFAHLSKFTEKTPFILTRELSSPDKEYTLEDNLFTSPIKKQIIVFLLKNLPYILYFDDFTDRVPEEIVFKEDYKTTGKLAFSKNREWQEIVVEIFRRAGVEGIDDDENPLKSFFHLDDKDQKDDILSDIEDVLNKGIIEEWKRIKKSGYKNFADDSDNLSLELKCEKNTFTFKVRDKSNQEKKRTFNVSERSKGFQWFFNYMIKLKFNPRYKVKKENSLFLLDEPGSYLHSSAQSELLKELKSVSEKNTIVYCTHSQYLLNPKTIKLGSIKIAEKENSTINLIEYGKYKSKDDRGALSTVYQALNVNFTNDFVGKIVITEGITDFYFFDLLKKYTKLFKIDFKIIAGAGSGNSTNLISVGLSFSENFVVLFDNDDGAKALKKYKKEFGESIINHFHLYNSEKGFALEDFICENDKLKLNEITKTPDIKRGLAILYYDLDESVKKDFILKLDKLTIKSLMKTIDIINSL